jgi:hypothetical protein
VGIALYIATPKQQQESYNECGYYTLLQLIFTGVVPVNG